MAFRLRTDGDPTLYAGWVWTNNARIDVLERTSTTFAWKVVAAVFWDANDMLLVECLERGIIILDPICNEKPGSEHVTCHVTGIVLV